jgi:hypothetical protein
MDADQISGVRSGVGSGPNSGPEFVRTCQDASHSGLFPSPSLPHLSAPQIEIEFHFLTYSVETPPTFAVARPLRYSDDAFILYSLSVVGSWHCAATAITCGLSAHMSTQTPYRFTGNMFYQRREEVNSGCNTSSDGRGRSPNLHTIEKELFLISGKESRFNRSRW